MSLIDLTKFSKFDCIKFYDTNHTYKINDVKVSHSVTRFLNLFVPAFDTEAAAQRIAKRNNVDVATVLSEWEDSKNTACLKGTLFHNYVENLLHNKVLPIDQHTILKHFNGDKDKANTLASEIAQLILQFRDFYQYYKDNFIHFKTEYVVGDFEDTLICGTIDNLSVCKKTGNLCIVDYKTNKKFTEKNDYNQYLNAPVSHLENTKLNIYGLQVGMYKYILEKYTNYNVDCIVVWFKETNKEYKLITPPNFSAEIKEMIKYYKTLS